MNLQQKCNLKTLQKIKFKKQKEQNNFYLENLKKIQDLLFYYNHKYYIPLEDLKSIAGLSFCDTLKYKDKQEYEFRVIFRRIIISKTIRNIIQKRIKQNKIEKVLKENKKSIIYELKPNLLSEEANEVIDLVYNAPKELLNETNKITKGAIKKYLRSNKNWKFEKINSIFNEIKMFLKEEF